MKIKSLIVVISLFAFVVALYAGKEERADGVQAAKDKINKILSEAEQAEANNTAMYERNYRTLSSINMKLDGGYYGKTADSDYTKAKTLDMLAKLGFVAASSIGTADLDKQIALLLQQSAALKASGDPQYAQVASDYDALAEALKSGNEIEAENIASRINEYVQTNAPSIDPGYQPTAKENSLLAGLASVLSQSLGAVGSMLTSFGLTKLLTLLGGAALASNPLSIAIGMILSNTIGAVASGISNNGVVDWQPVGDTASGLVTGGVSDNVNSANSKLQESLDKDIAQTTPIHLNTNTNAVVEGSKEHGETKAPK
jgi:hypothetical protein